VPEKALTSFTVYDACRYYASGIVIEVRR